MPTSSPNRSASSVHGSVSIELRPAGSARRNPASGRPPHRHRARIGLFWDRLPTTWDDTRVLDGAIGQFSVIARRKGEGWWLGCMNATEPRSLQLKVDFLASGAQLRGGDLHSRPTATATRTHVKITRQPVTAATVMTVELGKNDGRALEDRAGQALTLFREPVPSSSRDDGVSGVLGEISSCRREQGAQPRMARHRLDDLPW